MSHSYFDDPIYKISELFFRSYVEDGTIEVGSRSPAEIIQEYKVIISDFADRSGEIRRIPDHRTELFQRAQDEANAEIAVTLCALWVEHTVNGSLVAALERGGYDSQEITSLIRDLTFRNKVTVLWKLVGLTPLQEEHLSLIEQIMQARNAFVHYKWRPRDDSEYESELSRLDDAVSRSQILKEAFDRADNILHWNGRQEEIIEAYRQDVARQIKAVGPFSSPEPPSEESASDTPRSP